MSVANSRTAPRFIKCDASGGNAFVIRPSLAQCSVFLQFSSPLPTRLLTDRKSFAPSCLRGVRRLVKLGSQPLACAHQSRSPQKKDDSVARHLHRALRGRCSALACAARLLARCSRRATPGCGPLPSELQRLLSTLRELDERMTGARDRCSPPPLARVS